MLSSAYSVVASVVWANFGRQQRSVILALHLSLSFSCPVSLLVCNYFSFIHLIFISFIPAFFFHHVLFSLGEVECPEDGKFRSVCASCSCLLLRVVVLCSLLKMKLFPCVWSIIIILVVEFFLHLFSLIFFFSFFFFPHSDAISLHPHLFADFRC